MDIHCAFLSWQVFHSIVTSFKKSDLDSDCTIVEQIQTDFFSYIFMSNIHFSFSAEKNMLVYIYIASYIVYIWIER